MLFIEGISDAIIRKMNGHRSNELERYKHLSPEFTRQTTELIAGKLVDELEGMGIKMAMSPETEESRPEGGSQSSIDEGFSGGTNGAQTRDHQRDRLKFAEMR
jgi:hypothetical protein